MLRTQLLSFSSDRGSGTPDTPSRSELVALADIGTGQKLWSANVSVVFRPVVQLNALNVEAVDGA